MTSFEFPKLKEDINLTGKRVFLAVDLNVPIQEDRVVDDFRIRRNKETFEFLKRSGARTILVSHRTDETLSLRPVFDYLKKTYAVSFASSVEDARNAIKNTVNGAFVMLENIRKIGGEKEKKNDAAFAEELASLAEVYINEAFSISHRPHASIIGVPEFLPSYAGFMFAQEVENLSRSFSPARPALLILGGAKFETKLPLIEKFLNIADTIYIGGALANDIYRARGYEVGVSTFSDFIVGENLLNNPKVHVPSNVVVRRESGNVEKRADSVGKKEKIVDAGSEAISDLRSLMEKSAFVLWNGPLGLYEEGFDAGTVALAKILAESNAETIIGGGDSVAVVSKLGILDRFSFVSTGGGAMLEFLASGTLPGIEALLN